MSYQLIKQIRGDSTLRGSFMDLAVKVFDLSFKNWYEKGYWTDKYIPYVISQSGRVVANASVNIIDAAWQGEPRRYIQLGTVMTDPDFRNRGLSRVLIEAILEDYKEQCDAVYLFANQSVLGFYPKFGFIKAYEHQYFLHGVNQSNALNLRFKRLDMDKQADRERLKLCYSKSNPYSALSVKDNYGLLMFYCGQFMKNNVYYSELINSACIAEHHGSDLFCFDIFGGYDCSLNDMLIELAAAETERVILGFTPINPEGFSCSRLNDTENTLFILKGKENLFSNHKAMFPLLSHA